MMYFTIEQEMNHHDLIEYLLGYANDNSKTILEVSQEYQLEQIILDVLDTNIGQNVDPYECIEDIEGNIDEYVLEVYRITLLSNPKLNLRLESNSGYHQV